MENYLWTLRPELYRKTHTKIISTIHFSPGLNTDPLVFEQNRVEKKLEGAALELDIIENAIDV
jgi:hypothetical protein